MIFDRTTRMPSSDPRSEHRRAIDGGAATLSGKVPVARKISLPGGGKISVVRKDVMDRALGRNGR